MRDNEENALSVISHNFADAHALLKAMAAEGLPLPRLYRALGEITLNRRLVELLRNLEPEPAQVATSEDILELVQEAALLGLKLESGEGARILWRILQRHLSDLQEDFQAANVTRLRQLENARRDFVANVSHELKTPVTSIKGFVETLLAGALKEPENAARFLHIIAQQTDRLNEIIDDLLSLSRIEQEAERHQIAFARGNLIEVLQAAGQVCGAKAAAKNISLQVNCPDGLRASFNAPLLEQALVNLLDNAIKFSPADSTVRVEAEIAGSEIVIRVKDQGGGIAPEYLERIFERFYRVDAGRSRKEGGTGLGLAIVKHIAQAHGGRVTVASSPGQGSLFSLYLQAD
jgi:signal transduction histidine kinase